MYAIILWPTCSIKTPGTPVLFRILIKAWKFEMRQVSCCGLVPSCRRLSPIPMPRPWHCTKAVGSSLEHIATDRLAASLRPWLFQKSVGTQPVKNCVRDESPFRKPSATGPGPSCGQLDGSKILNRFKVYVHRRMAVRKEKMTEGWKGYMMCERP